MFGRLVILVHVLAGALILMGPALVNRSPFIFYDTAHYVLLGRSVLKVAFNGKDVSPAERDTADGPASASATPVTLVPPIPPVVVPDGGRAFMLTYVGGRSVYYSFVLALAIGLGGIWLVAFLQCVVGSWLCWTMVRLVPGRDTPFFYVLIAGMAACSSLPYFATFVMPDVLAAYAVLATALLLLVPTPVTRAGLWAVIAFGVAAHATNIIVVLLAAAGVAGIRLRLAGRQGFMPRAAWLASAIVIGALGSTVFALGTRILFHDVPHSPPYLTARVLADGPGRTYLAANCLGPETFTICRYRHLPLTDVNEILWSTDPGRGVFNFADYETRVRLSEEQLRFATASIASDPAASVAAMTRNAVAQLETLSIGTELGATYDSWNTLVKIVVPESGPMLRRSLTYRGLFPFRVVDTLIATTFLLSGAFVAFRLSRPDLRGRWTADDHAHRAAAILTGAAASLAVIILVNGAVCGILSGPTYRYQGRLTWLVPLLAFVIARVLGIGRAGVVGRVLRRS